MPFLAWRRTRHWAARRLSRMPPPLQGMLWAMAAGFIFSLLNAVSRLLVQQVDPFQSQFLRYLFGLLVFLPMVLRQGWTACRPQSMTPHFIRGGVHTLGLVLWYLALAQVPLADTTAIGFTTPLFIMLGAWLFLREPMRWERWLATGLGFAGMLIVISPQLSWSATSGPGWHHLLMLGSAPLFAASFLLTKNLTRTESSSTIVLWQALTITVLSLPLALPGWQPLGLWLWAGFVLSGLLGSAGQYCITQSFRAADISATQSVRFLDLIWAAWLGWVLFGEAPTVSTLVGGLLISAATVWVTHRESHLRAQGITLAPSAPREALTGAPDGAIPTPVALPSTAEVRQAPSGPAGSDRPR